MKFKILLIFLACGFIFLLNGCLPKPSCITDPGTLHLTFSLYEEQFHSSAVANDIHQIQIKLNHKEDKVTKETIADYTGENQELAVSGLYPGDWQVTVYGLDETGGIIFQGTEATFIKPAETTSIRISLLPAPGFLEVSCDISQIAGLPAETNGTLYVYLNPEDSNTKYYPLIREGNVVKTTVSIPEGTFQVKVAVPNVTTKLFISPYFTVTVQAGKTTVLTINANGSLEVTGTINSTPATPAGLTAHYNSTASSVLLTWTGVNESDITGYRIYRNNSEGRMVRIATVDKNTTNFTNNISSGDFFHYELKYAVSSYDSGGVESFWSEIAVVRK